MDYLFYIFPLINMATIPYLNYHTKPKNERDSQIELVFILFGVFCLPFIKNIKKIRLRLHLDDKREELRNLKFLQSSTIIISDIEKEICLLERKLKLININKYKLKINIW